MVTLQYVNAKTDNGDSKYYKVQQLFPLPAFKLKSVMLCASYFETQIEILKTR